MQFSDELIDLVISGRQPLSFAEREFLLNDTPRFEECTYTKTELSAMNDSSLMDLAYRVWAEYTRSMF